MKIPCISNSGICSDYYYMFIQFSVQFLQFFIITITVTWDFLFIRSSVFNKYHFVKNNFILLALQHSLSLSIISLMILYLFTSKSGFGIFSSLTCHGVLHIKKYIVYPVGHGICPKAPNSVWVFPIARNTYLRNKNLPGKRIFSIFLFLRKFKHSLFLWFF